MEAIAPVLKKKRLLKNKLIKKIYEENGDGLSAVQKRFWFLEQISNEKGMYNIPSLLRLKGIIDFDVANSAFQHVVEIHRSLSTGFHDFQGIPVAYHSGTDFSISMVNVPEILREKLGNEPTAEQVKCETVELAKKEELFPFSLDVPPLFRVTFLMENETECVLVINMHHIVSDHHSIEIIVNDFIEAYNTIVSGNLPSSPIFSAKYSDFVSWQKEQFETGSWDQQLMFWEQQLSGYPKLSTLPPDFTRPSQIELSNEYIIFRLDADLSQKVKAFAQQNKTTLFITLFSAFSILISRLSNINDVVIGTPFSNRKLKAFEEIVGPLINTIPLRVFIDSGLSFKEYVSIAKSVCIEGFSNSDIPFDNLVERWCTTKDESHPPIFQLFFALQHNDAEFNSFVMDGLKDIDIEFVPKDRPNSNFDLTLQMVDSGPVITGIFEYKSSLYRKSSIKQLISSFNTLLSEIVQHPDKPIQMLQLVSPVSMRKLLLDWNDTEASYPIEKCIHHLFEEQVYKTPNSIAVTAGDRTLTYSELDKQSNQLAHYLIDLGVTPDSLVAICTPRTVEMMIGIFGVLKAGGAYVPLDPDYPDARLAYMLEDSKAEIILMQSGMQTRFVGYEGERVLLDELVLSLDSSTARPRPLITSSNLAYVIYTSGSTGLPKGVMVEHKNTVALIAWASSNYTDKELSEVLASTAISFDVSIFEIFVPLCVGGMCRLVEDILSLVDDTANYSDVTLISTVPSAARMLIDNGGLPKSTMAVNFAGEPLTASLVDEIYQLGRIEKVFDLYGPSEDTTYSTFMLRTLRGVNSIGRPIANTQTYVLDDHQQPVPLGVAGELYLGGAGLARGYLNKPTLTAERFIANKFSDDPTARLYRTGDRVRYLEDGNLQFLGRMDNQVKIRGHRVELGEVEASLLSLSTVQNAVAVTHTDAAGTLAIVAYIVPDEKSVEHGEFVNGVREELKALLPDYMVPSLTMVLDQLPLTPNGKLDRKGLPAPDAIVQTNDGYIAPRTELESKLLAFWQELLGIERISVMDNFFLIGGHSLLATQLVSRIRQKLNYELSVRALFTYPTVESLAASLSKEKKDVKEDIVLYRTVSRDKPLPLSYAQERLWFLWQMEKESSTYHLPILLRLRGDVDIDALRKGFSGLVERHEVFRTHFAVEGSTVTQVISELVDLHFDHHSLIDEPTPELLAKQLVTEQLLSPFDLEVGKLVRLTAVSISANEALLLINMHHIVSDAWSLGILVKEFVELYKAVIEERSASLPKLAVHYGDYAVGQRERLQGDYLEAQLAYWRIKLADSSILALPTDNPRPSIQSYRGATLPIAIEADLLNELNALSLAHGCTLFMVLLSAFNILLHRYSGQDDICVGSPVANRTHSELEPIVGLFINTLVLRTDLSGNPTVEDLLSQVKCTTLDAYDHQTVPFEQVVGALKPERRLSHTPLFQAMLILQNAPGGDIRLPGLTVDVEEIHSETSKFDLTLMLSETDTGIRGSIEYCSDLFNAERIERMMEHFTLLLRSIVANPLSKIASLEMLTPNEYHTIADWNDTTVPYPKDKCIHQLFEEQVAKTPENIALVFEDQSLTYEALNQRANQVAHYLQSQGVVPGSLVAICVERSLEMLVGLLGILKAGGAYVPLDPDYPETRLLYMLEDTQAKVLLTHTSLSHRLPTFTGMRVALDDESLVADQPKTRVLSNVASNNLAYVIYTSGSTGQPKGVMVEHSGVVNRILWMQSAYYIDNADRVLQKTPFSFDVSVWELFWPLMVGAVEVIAAPGGHRDNDYLCDLIDAQQITTLHFVPSMLRTFLLFADKARCSGLRRVICSGEELQETIRKEFLTLLDHCDLYNLYGPTEASIDVTHYSCHEEASFNGVPIGRPISNTQVYVLDERQQPVPQGVAGELYLGGVGLARGYLNKPELTAEKFIPDPFSSDSESRLYKTGDRVRYLEDGNLQFLGRMDNQVKIRGHRIELGEVEASLLSISAVQAAAAVTHTDAADSQTMVAYLVPADKSIEHGEFVNGVRAELKALLPDYMVPSLIMVVDSIPLSPNGKLDRKKIPDFDSIKTVQTSHTQPKNDLEKKLLNVWEKLLNRKNIGVDENFFDVGGTSLSAVTLVIEIQNVLNIKATVLDIFQNPSISSFVENFNQIQQPRINRTGAIKDARSRRKALKQRKKNDR